MSAVPTPRVGFSQGYTLGENNWNLGYDENWQVLDRIVSSDFGIFSIASRVLVLLGGTVSTTTGVTSTTGATITATASTTTFIERDAAGAITHNSTGFTAGKIPLYTAAANASAVTSVLSYRAPHQWNGTRMILPSNRALIIDQGADDGEIFALKSSDVAHGMTSVTDTDTYGLMRKIVGTTGGLLLQGFGEDTFGLWFEGMITNDTTPKTGAAVAAFYLNGTKKSGTTFGAQGADANVMTVANNSTPLMVVDADGDVHVKRCVNIGAMGSAHSAAVGLTVNQGTEDGSIITLKSTGDVAHGMTTSTSVDTDTYFTMRKRAGAGGGFMHFLQGDATDRIAWQVEASVVNPDTLKSASAWAPIFFSASKKSGSTIAAMGANENLMVVTNASTTKFILDADGDSHQDVGTLWTNFDIVRDIELLNVAAAHLTAPTDPLKASFHGWLAKDRAVLERHKLVTFNEDGHHFINWSRMSMLLIGALRQLGAQVEHMREQLNLPEHPSIACLPKSV